MLSRHLFSTGRFNNSIRFFWYIFQATRQAEPSHGLQNAKFPKSICDLPNGTCPPTFPNYFSPKREINWWRATVDRVWRTRTGWSWVKFSYGNEIPPLTFNDPIIFSWAHSRCWSTCLRWDQVALDLAHSQWTQQSKRRWPWPDGNHWGLFSGKRAENFFTFTSNESMQSSMLSLQMWFSLFFINRQFVLKGWVLTPNFISIATFKSDHNLFSL